MTFKEASYITKHLNTSEMKFVAEVIILLREKYSLLERLDQTPPQQSGKAGH